MSPSFEHRERVDLTYDGGCLMVLRQALAPCSDLAPGTSAPRYRLRLNALEPRVQTNMVALARSVRVQPSGWRSEGPRGSA